MNTKKICGLVLSMIMALSVASVAYAAPKKDKTPEAPVEAASLDDMSAPALDNSKANRLPMTGYFTKTIGENRTMKVYLAEGIHIRDYYTVIAVPDDVDTDTFLKEGGWFAKADSRSEGLIVLEPGEDGWGSAEDESEYVNAAIGFYAGNSYFSVFGEHYFVGYGKGADALEYWAAANPLKVISQVYVGGSKEDKPYLEELGEAVQPTKAGSYNQVYFPEDFDLLQNKDAVLPTWLIGSSSKDSQEYWKSVNDCVKKSVNDSAYGKVWAQAADSDNWTTDYSGPISKVAVKNANKKNSKALTEEICQFLYYYTRYENAFIYGNQLSVRADLSGMEVKTLTVNGHPREYMVYQPENMMENTPVMFIWPGNTQTDRVFFDATQWKEVADKEGFMIVMICEDYDKSTTVTHKDAQAFQIALLDAIKTDYAGKVDPERFYGTGQSLGSMTTQSFAAINPEFYAAVASTSGPATVSRLGLDPSEYSYQYTTIPTYMIYGQGDLPQLEGTLWDNVENELDEWAAYMLAANGLEFTDVAEDAYTVKALDAFGHKNLHTWTWTKTVDGIDVPLVQLSENMVRAHNCISAEMPELWDYAKHFKVTYNEDGSVSARYYSASAFAEDDAVVIWRESLQKSVVSIDTRSIPNFYGQRLAEAVITFREGTDMEAVAAADVTVWDRGSADPQFGRVPVTGTEIKGNQLILTFDQDTAKTADRARNAFGLYSTANWYMDTEGNIFAGTEDSQDALGNTIYANKTKKGYQPRKNLDLILTIDSEITDGLAMTDGKGNLLEDSVWNPMENEVYDRIEVVPVNVGWEAPNYDMVTDNGEIPVHVIWPEGYDPNREEAYPLVFFVTGLGTCYWQLTDTTVDGVMAPANNLGDNVAFDNMVTGWAQAWPEAIVISPNVHSSSYSESATEVNAVLEYFVEHYNVDTDKIVGVGNSFGTQVISDALRQRPDLVDVFVSNNGRLGLGVDASKLDGTWETSSISHWTADERQGLIDNKVAIWFLNGETDSAHPRVTQEMSRMLTEEYKAAGYSDAWIFDNLRISGMQSWKFKHWGETDHSVTKMTAFYYVFRPYTDVWEGMEDLKPGDTYTFTGQEAANYYGAEQFEYTVYAENVAEWARNAVNGMYDEEDEEESSSEEESSDSQIEEPDDESTDTTEPAKPEVKPAAPEVQKVINRVVKVITGTIMALDKIFRSLFGR